MNETSAFLEKLRESLKPNNITMQEKVKEIQEWKNSTNQTELMENAANVTNVNLENGLNITIIIKKPSNNTDTYNSNTTQELNSFNSTIQ